MEDCTVVKTIGILPFVEVQPTEITFVFLQAAELDLDFFETFHCHFKDFLFACERLVTNDLFIRSRFDFGQLYYPMTSTSATFETRFFIFFATSKRTFLQLEFVFLASVMASLEDIDDTFARSNTNEIVSLHLRFERTAMVAIDIACEIITTNIYL